MLREQGWVLAEAADGDELVRLARDTAPDLIVIEAPDRMNAAIAVVRRLHEDDRRTPILLIVPRCDGEIAIAAMRAGVNDILCGGFGAAEVGEVLRRIVRQPEPARHRALVAGERLVGRSRQVEQLRGTIDRLAATDANVLITGETGTGKELTAELIHRNSKRRDKPFVSINCAAIPDGLLESELFGYERGAFTGAHAAREGKLQYGNGGTLFLDEIGDMNLYAQAKILRAIESRKVQRLGANREVAINVRIIAATNQNLEQLTSQQKFRRDLYFRLNVARIHLPPLREHADDIADLVRYLVAEIAPRYGRRVESVNVAFLEPLQRYDWPGNVRELRNVIESTLVFCASEDFSDRDLPPYIRALFASEERKRECERERVTAALARANGNRNEAARLLGCSRMTLYRKMIKFGLFESTSGDDAEDIEEKPRAAGA